MNAPPPSRRSRARAAFTLIEVLAAALLLSIAAAAAVKTWSIASRAPYNKRVTEMGIYIGTQELERLKARRYDTLVRGSSGVDWYDENGAWLGNSAVTGTYKANWSVGITGGVDRDGINNSEDLLELKVIVTNAAATKTYETAQTLLTFGGI